MKKQLTFYIWEAIAFGSSITILRIYLLKNEPDYTLLLQGLIAGTLWAIVFDKIFKVKVK